MEDAPVLRARLATADPTLSGFLEEAGRIARNEWLPALPTNSGSSNAYPHLRNVAGYLEHIILAFEADAERGFVPLSAGEIYVVLLAVLFHDYGRLDPRSSPRNTRSRAHGTLSAEHLGRHHARLGIHTREVAELVGRIAECHEFDPSRIRDEAARHWKAEGEPWKSVAVAYALAELTDTLIDSVGAIRTPLLAGLLALADQMDAAYTRSIPEYLTNEQGGVIGLFRRHIRGVYVDPKTKLVKTVMTLDVAEPAGPEASGPANERPTLYAVSVRKRTADGQVLFESLRLDSQTDIPMLQPTNAKAAYPDIGAFWPLPAIKTHWLPLPETHPDYKVLKLLASHTIELQLPPLAPCKTPQDAMVMPCEIPMPMFGPQAIAFGNMDENVRLLEQVAPVLGRYGISLDSWLVEMDGRLFRHDGAETFESIVSRKLLEDAAKAMWALSTRIFGATSFTYEDVAAYLGDPNVRRVKIACQRVAAAAFAKTKTDGNHPVPWTGTDRWHWHGKRARDGRKCGYACLVDATGFITNELEDPHA